MFKEKMKRFKKVLSQWSKRNFGNVFQKIQTAEDLVNIKELQLEIHPSEEKRANLRRAKNELQKFKKIEEEYWKQKAGMKWFTEGDKNTILSCLCKEKKKDIEHTEDSK